MDELPQAPENSPFIRYGFAAIFVAACLYDLVLGMRVAGVFLLGMALYEGVSGRVPLVGVMETTKGYVKGPIAMAITVGTIFVAMFFILAPELILRLLAESQGLPAPH